MRHSLKKLALAIALCLVAGSAMSQSRKIENCTAERQPPSAVWKSEGNFNAVQEAWELVANEQYREAEAEFSELVGKIKDPFERSQAMFGLAQAQMAQDKFDGALNLYEEIVNMDVLQNQPHFDAMFQIAQLYYMRERYENALNWVDRWEQESCSVKVQAYELRASIHSQRDEFRKAIENIDKAIALSDKPKETWYQLKLAMHYELKEYEESREVLEILVRNWPAKKQYWSQLSSINVTLKNDEEALAVLALAHRKGLLEKEQDWIQLFSLYGYMGIPYKAAEVMDEGLDKGFIEPSKKHYEQLGNAWYAARELDRAVAALTKAADLALDGKIAMQVAYILVDKENWDAAIDALRTAIEKGGLTDVETGNLQVLLGMSELNSGNPEEARKAFQTARKFPKSRQSAQQWLNHLEELKKRSTSGA